MWVEDNQKMAALVAKTGSPYSAAMYAAKKARRLKAESYHVINDSVALEWAISGKQPEGLDDRIKRQMEKDEIEDTDRLQVVLDTIEDESVRVAVLNSYRATIRAKRLVYDYNDIRDEHMKAKIRILTKMAYIV